MTTPLDLARSRIAAALRQRAIILDLHGLGLDTLPDELWQLTWLESLNLANNRLSSLDPRFTRLKALRILDLRGNRLHEVDLLIQLPALTELSLADNPIIAPPTTRLDDKFLGGMDDIDPLGMEFRMGGDDQRLGAGGDRPDRHGHDKRAKPPAPGELRSIGLPGPTAGAEPPEIPAVPPPSAIEPPPATSPAFPSADRSTTPPAAADADEVESAVFCPPTVTKGSSFLVQFYLYPPEAAATVATEARQADTGADRRGTYALPLDVPRGTRIDIRLEMPGLTLADSDAVLTWRGRSTVAQFDVTVPADAVGTNAIGRIRIAVAGIPTGVLRFQVGLTDADVAPNLVEAREIDGRRYRRAFVSYSSKDRAEVLRRVQAFKIAGISVFQDVLE